MRIQIVSDLHLEFGESIIHFDDADCIILAGDVHLGIKGIEWILKKIPNKPVIYVLGNHEYYKGTYPKTLNKIEELAKGSNVHVLENNSVILNGVCFHGCTLWTDFSLFGSAQYFGAFCQEKMNDYKNIRRDPSYSKLRSIDTYQIHKKSLNWLENSLLNSRCETNIVVTHHAPSLQSVPDSYKTDPISSAYASNLEEMINRLTPDFWIHGHIHTPVDYIIGSTKVICNPHGYINELYNGFNNQFILDIR